jgi:polyribonucleotide nucleotidyltransferase
VCIKDFFEFFFFSHGKVGLVNISYISKDIFDNFEDVISLGDIVKVVCLGKDKMGRISFSIKDVK